MVVQLPKTNSFIAILAHFFHVFSSISFQKIHYYFNVIFNSCLYNFDIFWHCSNTEASQKHPKLKLLFVTVALYYGSVVSSARTAFLLSFEKH